MTDSALRVTERRLVVVWALIGALCAPLAPSVAMPVKDSQDTVKTVILTTYVDGFCVAPCTDGVAYVKYSTNGGLTWSDITPTVRATVLAGVKAGTTTISGLGGVQYGGNGDNLVEHTANYGIDKGYQITFDGSAVTVNVEISFQPDPTIPGDLVSAKIGLWESAIEGWLNDRYEINKDNEWFFPIQFDITTGGRLGYYDQNVMIHPGDERADEANWYYDNDDQTIVHEFAHMLGIYDEYWGGAVNMAASPITDYTNLMGSSDRLAFGTGLKPLYYDDFRVWLRSKDKDLDQIYSLARVPGPATFALVAAALPTLALAGLLRARRRAARGEAGPSSREERPALAPVPGAVDLRI